MRFSLAAVAIIAALSLIACNGPAESTPEVRPEDTPAETPEHATPSSSATPQTRKIAGNILIETPEYTGVIISESGASEFSFMLNEAPTEFWEPSVDDVSRAEKCIRQFLVSLQDDPELDTYQKEYYAFILENLKDYRRQYVGIVVDGEKRIWCNSFLSENPYPDWQRLPVFVLDGGHYYWEIEYILDRDDCINFYVHGEA
jgi:hypothetical protein